MYTHHKSVIGFVFSNILLRVRHCFISHSTLWSTLQTSNCKRWLLQIPIFNVYKIIGFFACLLLLSCSNCKSKPSEPRKDLIPRALLFGNPEKTLPKLSPDGTKLAFVAPDKNGILNVYVEDLSENNKTPLQITKDEKRGVWTFFWQEDSHHILYLKDTAGDENWHLYQTDLVTKTAKDLTPQSNLRADVLAYDKAYPNEILVQHNGRNPELFDVYRINLQTGESVLDTENPGAVFDWIVDSHLEVRGADSYLPDGSTLIQVRNDAKSPFYDFLHIEPDDMHAKAVGFSPDGLSLYLVSAYEQNTSCLQKVDLATKTREILAQNPRGDISDVLINPTTHALEAASFETDKEHWIILDQTLTTDFKILSRLEKGNTFSILSRDSKDQKWVIAVSSDKHPKHFYLYDRLNQKASFLFSAQPALEKYKLASMQPISFRARDGMQLFGYLTLPSNKKIPAPMVLMVHGGPWMRDSWEFDPSVQWLANRGYAVLQINFRGSSGYGKKYINAGDHEWAGKMHTDLLDGKAWAISHGYARADKVAIYGGSYGGYATLVGLAFTPNEFCCGVDVVGPSNLITLLKSIPPYWASVKTEFNIRVGSPDTDEQDLIARSPLFKAQYITKPLLIGQGAQDPRVNQAESDQIVALMRKNKLPVEYILFPNEGHGFARADNRLCFYAAMESFLAKYLGGPCQKPSPEEDWSKFKK